MKKNVAKAQVIVLFTEMLLGIPILGWWIATLSAYTALAMLLITHIIMIFLTRKVGLSSKGNIVGIFSSLFGWLPGGGMILHLAAFMLITKSIEHVDISNKKETVDDD